MIDDYWVRLIPSAYMACAAMYFIAWGIRKRQLWPLIAMGPVVLLGLRAVFA